MDPLLRMRQWIFSKTCIVLRLLYFNEINNLNINSDLVILSACNTRVGKVTNGEGINSIARSFAHAGRHNILISLWPISDKSTTSLIKEYYKELVGGNSKKASLSEAKNSFLSNIPAAFHHPYFWGGFVYYGDDTVLRVSSGYKINTRWVITLFDPGN